jgi:hypothetical protein
VITDAGTPDAGESEDAGEADAGRAIIDAGAPDAGPSFDAGAATYGDYCQPCSGQGECGDGGFCLQSENGMLICGSPCGSNGDCPSTASCVQINNSSGVFEGLNCYPNSAVCPAVNEPDAGSTLYCQPCSSSSQCGSGLCLEAENGTFCGTPCTSSSQCPTGAYCATLGNTSEMNCAPDDGVCPIPVDAGPGDAGPGSDAGAADAGVPLDAGAGGESDGGLVTIPLTGCPSVGYSAPVTIGGSQQFVLVVDTGSSTLAVAASDCDDCTGISPLYTPGATSTNLNASSTSTYGDGSSWSAELYSDNVTVGAEMPTVSLDFAAINDEKGNFFPTIGCDGNTALDTSQGILGMGPADLEAGGTQGYFQQLIATGAVADVFAVQLCATGGNMWFGGYDAAFVSGAPQFTPMVMSDYYAITLSQVSFDGTPLSYNASEGGAALVDTGTTLLILPNDGFNELAAAAAANTAVADAFPGITAGFFNTNTCMGPGGTQTSADLDATLPTLALEFPTASGGSFTVQFPATSSYFTPLTQNGTTLYCSGIAPSGSPATTILGASILTAYVTVFDPSHMQVGFAPQVGCQ